VVQYIAGLRQLFERKEGMRSTVSLVPKNTMMKHFEHYPFLKARMEQPVFFSDLLNRYFFSTAFICNRYHQSLAQVLETILDLALTERIIALGRYSGKKTAAEFQKMTGCASSLSKPIEGLSPGNQFLLVGFLVHAQKAFENGYKQDALVNLLKLLLHIEKRYADLETSARLFRKRRENVVFPTVAEVNKVGLALSERLESRYFTRKKIIWSDPGFDAVLESIYTFLKDAKSRYSFLLSVDVKRTIERQFRLYYDRWALVSEIKSALLKGEPI
jgi:hypothetical protein